MGRAFTPHIITEDRSSGAQVIDGSLRFVSGRYNYLARTPSSAGNQKTWTFSVWFKKDTNGNTPGIFMPTTGGDNSNETQMRFTSSDNLQIYDSGGTYLNLTTTQLFRDPASWYHLVIATDTTKSVTADRCKIYVNGTQVTDFDTTTYPGQYANLGWNSTYRHDIGRVAYNGSNYFDGCISQMHQIDGQALGPEYFGYTDPLTNTWRPKKFEITGPNNGTTWSSTTTMNSNVFDGALADTANDRFLASSSNGYYTATTAPFTINQSLSVVTGDGYHWTARLNGSTEVTTGDPSTSMGHNPDIRRVDFDLSGVTLPLDITNLELKTGTGTGSTYIMGIVVDGVLLIDGDTTNIGLNGFHLPFDGNSPIGEDKSGNGNNFTPLYFVESKLSEATGAIPLLNTNDAGTVAMRGIRTDKKTYTVTASGGKYYLDGVETPTLNFLRGGTYIFDYTGATSHPFKFSTTSDGTHNSGTEYTDGTNTATSNVMKITVPHNAPDTLYYYCSNHSGMGSSINVTTDIFKADPYAWKCMFAMASDAVDISPEINVNSTASVFTDVHTTNPQRLSNFYGTSKKMEEGGGFRIDWGLTTADANAKHKWGTGDFTIECWHYTDGVDTSWKSYYRSYTYETPTAGATGISHYGLGETLLPYWRTNTSVGNFGQTGNIVPYKRWNHTVWLREGTENRMYVNGTLVKTFTDSKDWDNRGFEIGDLYTWGGGYQDARIYVGVAKYTSNFVVGSIDPDIVQDTPSGVAYSSALTKVTDGSVGFDGSGDYLSLANNTDFNLSTNDFTFQFWIYYTGSANIYSRYDYVTNNRELYCSVQSDGVLQFRVSHNGTNYDNHTAPAGSLRPNAWNYVVITRVVDGSNSIYRSWVDGNLIKKTTIAQTTVHYNSQTTYIGDYLPGTISNSLNGFLSNFRLINGTALYTSDDSITVPTEPLTNITNTKLLCCQSTTSATAAAVSPGSITANGNAAATNFTPFNTDIDAVRGQESGYPSLNPLTFRGTGVITNNNLVLGATGGDCCAAVTVPIPTDKKIYLEAHHHVTAGAGNRAQIGVVNVNIDTGAVSRPGGQAGGWAYDFSTSSGNSGAYDEGTRTAYPEVSDGDICMWCIDLSAGLMWAGKNGIWFNSGNPAAGTGAIITGIPNTATGLKVSVDGGTTNRSELTYNFGQTPFKFPPPDGFQTLNTANSRPSTVIARPDKYFKTVLWTGDGNDNRSITGVGFQPSLTWIKTRSVDDNHVLHDEVRGANRQLFTNTTDGEFTGTTLLKSFDSDGFTLGTDSAVNGLNRTLVAWCWKAGGAAVSNTNGSITSQVSASQDAGFSIVSYTGNGSSGATVGHGCGVAPSMMIVKRRTNATSTMHWSVYHQSIGSNKIIYLDVNNAAATSGAFWNNTTPTSTVFTIGTDNDVNTLNEDYIAYCWSEVPGFSKFGTYVGNDVVDGIYIHCGFRPAMLMIKRVDTSGTGWVIVDSVRETYNPVSTPLFANANIDEPTSASTTLNDRRFPVDFLSNGFKMRVQYQEVNGATGGSFHTYIYCAWAEAPSFNLYGAQANAR